MHSLFKTNQKVSPFQNPLHHKKNQFPFMFLQNCWAEMGNLEGKWKFCTKNLERTLPDFEGPVRWGGHWNRRLLPAETGKHRGPGGWGETFSAVSVIRRDCLMEHDGLCQLGGGENHRRKEKRESALIQSEKRQVWYFEESWQRGGEKTGGTVSSLSTCNYNETERKKRRESEAGRVGDLPFRVSQDKRFGVTTPTIWNAAGEGSLSETRKTQKPSTQNFSEAARVKKSPRHSKSVGWKKGGGGSSLKCASPYKGEGWSKRGGGCLFSVF